MSYQPVNIDTIAVFDSGYNQVFKNARPIRCVVKNQVKAMEHPVETGQIISDYKINLPIEIILTLIVPSTYYADTYAQIYGLLNTSELLAVSTRPSYFQNMIVTEMPDEETVDMFDSIKIELHLKQVLLVTTATSFNPAQPTQSDTVQSGQQSATTTTLPANSNWYSPSIVQSGFNVSDTY